MAEALSPGDRSSLAAEQGPVNMAVGAVLVFEGGRGLDYDAVVERLRTRLHLIPRYRQRLASAVPGVAQPEWVDDEHFDLRWHVRHVALPPPGGDAELAAFVGSEFSRKLDRDRPLWELTVVEGLEGGRVALVPRMHHALVDGIGAIDVGTVLLDPSAEPIDIPPPEGPWEPQAYDRGRHLARLAATPFVRAQKMMLDTATRALDTSPRRAAEDLRRATDLMTELARNRPQAPMTPLNEPISPNRRYAIARASLPELKAAGKRAGGTVNDALLAVVTGMLRRYFEAAGLNLDAAPVALVPVSVRREGERGALGNRISTVFVDLPIAERDPLVRLRRISETMRALKESSAVQAGALLVGATGWAPPLVSSVLARAMGGVRAFNLVVSNVPGPQQPFYLGGSRMLEVFPIVPLNPVNQRLSVGILSYDGGVFFGLLADRDLEPSVEVGAQALQTALEELLEAAAAA
ncbi:MAG TPA: wax ester/triacylglycerol synthase family O-acyltransferase [Solirubrobacteraceae bacterium]|nr:wax ester/triacylglycerol synthase family O-acyltransferase [Solirubrobacteraceae bacterium]